MTYAVARYNATLAPAAQKVLADALASFDGKMEAMAFTKSAQVSCYKVKGAGKERFNGSKEKRTLETDYGTSPLGLQLAAYYGAEKLEFATGCRILDVGLVPGVRVEKVEVPKVPKVSKVEVPKVPMV